MQQANAVLSKLVLQLIEETKCEQTPETLELAFLYFIDRFRKLFIHQYARKKDTSNPSVFATGKGPCSWSCCVMLVELSRFSDLYVLIKPLLCK